jgi:hypothetical protein
LGRGQTISNLICKLELWIYGAGMVLGLLLIGAAMLTDIERHTWNECEPDDDREERTPDDEEQMNELPLG